MGWVFLTVHTAAEGKGLPAVAANLLELQDMGVPTFDQPCVLRALKSRMSLADELQWAWSPRARWCSSALLEFCNSPIKNHDGESLFCGIHVGSNRCVRSVLGYLVGC